MNYPNFLIDASWKSHYRYTTKGGSHRLEKKFWFQFSQQSTMLVVQYQFTYQIFFAYLRLWKHVCLVGVNYKDAAHCIPLHLLQWWFACTVYLWFITSFFCSVLVSFHYTDLLFFFNIGKRVISNCSFVHSNPSGPHAGPLLISPTIQGKFSRRLKCSKKKCEKIPLQCRILKNITRSK